MKNSISLLLISFLHFSTIAQNNFDVEQKNVANQVEALRVAMIEADSLKLKELTSSDLSYGHSGGHIENQAEFIKKIVSGKSDFVSIELKNQTISVSDNVAVVRHKLYAHTNDSGVEKDIQLGVMLIWQKTKKKWLLIARQAFKLPINDKH